MKVRRVHVFAIDYELRTSGRATCHVVAPTAREAKAIAAAMHPGARILEARADVGPMVVR